MNMVHIGFIDKYYNLEISEKDQIIFEISTGEKFSRKDLKNYRNSSKITLLMISLINSNPDVPLEELLKVGIKGHSNIKKVNKLLKTLF